jgi:signal transduction histidine kinase
VVAYAIGMVLFFMLGVLFARNFRPANEEMDWSVPNPIGFIEDTTINAIFSTPWSIALGILTTLSVAALIARYRRAGAFERQQMKWLLYVCGLFAIVCIPLAMVADGEFPARLLNDLFQFFFLSSISAFPLAIGTAILRYRLYDIDVIINRTLVYGSLTALVIGLYVLVVGYLGTLLRTENSLLVSLLATGVVAVMFQPLRDRLQLGVNRLIYGQRDEPVTVLSQLGARLQETILPDEILPRLVDTVSQTLKLPYVAVALQVNDQLKIQAEIGPAPRSPEAFPLIYQGETIGQLLVSRRSPSEDLNPADRFLLANIASQAGVVAHSVRLTSALQQSRQQLVTTREEERRRLRRDLHDGLGPQLASQTLTIDAISKLLERDPEKARDLLEHLKAQSQAAIQDIRRLVYGLRPPALDELGLVGALHEGARQNGHMINDVEIITDPQPLPTLPAAVEVAVYRIAQEAITNVLRHAQAKHCIVSIQTQDHHLDLTITDDGRGYPDDFHFGVGLKSMRERAEELGGTIRFENQLGGGARVQVWLPLPGDEE